MRAISLWQPWASAIVLGHKEYETRHWPPPESLFGKRILIHAAKRPFRAQPQDLGVELYNRIRMDGIFEQLLLGRLPFGAIVGSAILVSTHRTEDVRLVLSEKELSYGNYDDERQAWRFTDSQAFATPIPYRGLQSFFEVPDELVPEVLNV